MPVRVAPADPALHAFSKARTRGPLRLAVGRIAARLIEVRAWERLGFARLADYGRERAGLSARQLQDLAHTSERLSALAGVEAALAAGRLGWSQARLVARVATPEDESRWIAFARAVRVSELEHAVRAVDRGSLEGAGLETDEDGCDATFKVGVLVRCTPRVRAKFHAARALARRVAGEALANWACMEAVAAEALSGLPIGAAPEACEGGCAVAGEGGSQRPSNPSGVAWGEEAVLEPANLCAIQGGDWVAPLLADLESADTFELDARLRLAVAQEQRLDAELAPFAAIVLPERLGISPRKARALRRIERAAAGCPELRAAFRSGRLSWVQVQAILPVLFLEGSRRSRAWWIEHAARVSVRRLYDDVDHALSGGESDWQTNGQTCAQGKDAEATHAEPETARFFFAAPPDVARLFHAVVCSVRRLVERATGRLPSEGAAIEWMFDHAFEAWGARDRRVAREHRVFERDGWRCTVPGCSSYRNLHDHHIVFRGAGGSDDLGNRTTLCAWHHLRGVHAARVSCRGSAPGGLVFELGLRPGREPLLRYSAGEVLNRPSLPGAAFARP
jgi:hypothetical protein